MFADGLPSASMRIGQPMPSYFGRVLADVKKLLQLVNDGTRDQKNQKRKMAAINDAACNLYTNRRSSTQPQSLIADVEDICNREWCASNPPSALLDAPSTQRELNHKGQIPPLWIYA